MPHTFRTTAALLLIAFGLMIGPAAAQQGPAPQAAANSPPTALRVVTRVLPPMVIERNGKFTGFSIELWDEIARRLNITTTYHAAPDIRALLNDVRTQKGEIGVAAISITSAREEEFEFSQPILNAGLQIMVSDKGGGAGTNPLTDLMRLLFSYTTLLWLGLAVLLIMIPAHLVYFLERRHHQGIIPTNNYFPGIFYALYWAAGTLATQADHAPRHWISRVIALLWMFVGIVFVALYTAQLTANLTVQQIAGDISGPKDLAGKTIATTRGSTAANAVRDLGANVLEVARIDDAYRALNDKQADAVVFDSPVLLYHAANDGKGRVQMVGAPFKKEDYGILFPKGHPLRTRINVTLLALREDGTYQRIYDKWFGTGK